MRSLRHTNIQRSRSALHWPCTCAAHVRVTYVCSKSRMSHVTQIYESYHKYEWVVHSAMYVSHTYESWNRYHVTHQWVMSNTNESCHTPMSYVTRILMRHVAQTTESRTAPCTQLSLRPLYMSVARHMNKSYHTYEWVMLHTSLSHVTHIAESRTAAMYTIVLTASLCMSVATPIVYMSPHPWTSHITHMNEPRHTYTQVMDTHEWVTSHL